MTNFNSGKLLKEAETIGYMMIESENKFIYAMGEKLLEMAREHDVEAILRFKEGIERSMPGIWEEYWEI
jgi:hypothetical protein